MHFKCHIMLKHSWASNQGSHSESGPIREHCTCCCGSELLSLDRVKLLKALKSWAGVEQQKTRAVARRTSRQLRPNLMASLCFLYDCGDGWWKLRQHFNFTELSIIIRLATDPVVAVRGCWKCLCGRTSVRERKSRCWIKCVLITLVQVSSLIWSKSPASPSGGGTKCSGASSSCCRPPAGLCLFRYRLTAGSSTS